MAKVELKQPIVQEISENLKDAQSLVVVDYRGLTVEADTVLRKSLREAGVVYKVYKNTLVRKALNELGITDFDADLNGTTATVFCADETSGAAVFAKETKANPVLVEKIVPKCAFVENKYLDKDGVKALASIPSKEVLIAKMLGCFQSSLSKFVGVLDQIAKAKESN